MLFHQKPVNLIVDISLISSSSCNITKSFCPYHTGDEHISPGEESTSEFGMNQSFFPCSFSSWIIYFPWKSQVLQEQHPDQQLIQQVSRNGLLHVLTWAQSVSGCSWCSWDTLSFGVLGMPWSKHKPSRAHFWWQCDNGRAEHRAGETPGLTQALGTIGACPMCVCSLLEFWVHCGSESCRCCSHHRAEHSFPALSAPR